MTQPGSRDHDTGYRVNPGHGPRVRTDVIDVYVFCRVPPGHNRKSGFPDPIFSPTAPGRDVSPGPMGGESFGSDPARLFVLQLLRARDPLHSSWHPVMGHIESHATHHTETAAACAARELREEVSLDPFSPDCLGFWALEQVHPFFIASIDSIVLAPRFAAEVRPGWKPTLNGEHNAHRWVDAAHAKLAFMWPGQSAAIREIRDHLLPIDSLCRESLRVSPADLSAKPT